MDRKIITRSEAIEAGLNKYFTGVPCKRGHIAERRTLYSVCIACEGVKRAYIISKQRARKAAIAAGQPVAEVV